MWRGTEEPLDDTERGEWKGWHKTQHSKSEDHGSYSNHFMANSYGKSDIAWAHIEWHSWAPKLLQVVTAAMKLKDACSLEEGNLESIFKSRDITLPMKVHIGKAVVFPAVMCGCESWTIKKVEHKRIDAFELWCWKRLFFFFFNFILFLNFT